MSYKSLFYLLPIIFLFFVSNLSAQEENPPKEYSTISGLWTGIYTKYRISEKMFYYGEYHYRRRENLINEMAQVYLRFGLTYRLKHNTEVTAGIVTPIYFAPQSLIDDPLADVDETYMQFRFWQQLKTVQSFDRLKLYHQFRTEQRWKRDYEKGSEYYQDWRFRYKLTAYYPLNKPKLVPKTLFLSLYEEILIQAGKNITYNYFEDNRLYAGLGYIVNENIQIQAGYMWTFRYNGGPNKFESRHIPRISIYHNLDFFGKKQKKKKLKPLILEDQL